MRALLVVLVLDIVLDQDVLLRVLLGIILVR